MTAKLGEWCPHDGRPKQWCVRCAPWCPKDATRAQYERWQARADDARAKWYLSRRMSLASRFELLLDLYAPMTEHEGGSVWRDPSFGLISQADFVKLADEPVGNPTSSAKDEK